MISKPQSSLASRRSPHICLEHRDPELAHNNGDLALQVLIIDEINEPNIRLWFTHNMVALGNSLGSLKFYSRSRRKRRYFRTIIKRLKSKKRTRNKGKYLDCFPCSLNGLSATNRRLSMLSFCRPSRSIVDSSMTARSLKFQTLEQ